MATTSDHGGGPSVRLLPFSAAPAGRGSAPAPELSVIVPILNEAAHLPSLFETLAAQRQVDFELILCDGGSDDGSAELLVRLASDATFPTLVLASLPGRGRQLNAGAAAARGATLLFLHVDSAFPDFLAFRRGLTALRDAAGSAGPERVAGHFALRFDNPGTEHTAGYHFFATKARLGRVGTIHGDQGFLLSARLFQALGPFEEGRAVLEDTRFADALLAAGRWLLLPAEIVTSTRRFSSEGLPERQILNALLMNFSAIGWEVFSQRVPGLYLRQDRTRPLNLAPFLRLLDDLLASLPRRERWRIYYRTGAYVRSQSWQLGLALDCRRLFRLGYAPGEGSYPWLRRCDRWFDPLTDHPLGYLLTGLLVRAWFILLRRRCERRRERNDE